MEELSSDDEMEVSSWLHVDGVLQKIGDFLQRLLRQMPGIAPETDDWPRPPPTTSPSTGGRSL